MTNIRALPPIPPQSVDPMTRLARAHAIEALQVAIGMMRDTAESGKVRLAAVNVVLDRAFGKAQRVNLMEDDPNAGAPGSWRKMPSAQILGMFTNGRKPADAGAAGTVSPEAGF